MAFDIKFIGEEFEDEGVRLRRVMLAIGPFEELMDADMTYWSVGDYQVHWVNELSKVTGPFLKGALITSLPDPKVPYRVWTWPMWREGDDILFQNRLIGMVEPDPRFHTDRLEDFVGERVSVNEDGMPISEWSVPLRDVIAFVHRVKL